MTLPVVSVTRLLVLAIVLVIDASNVEGSVVCFTLSVVDGSVDVTGDVVGSLSPEKSFILLILPYYVFSESIYYNYTIRPTLEDV